jgi:hypothetical protein
MEGRNWTFVRKAHEEWVKVVDNMAKTLAYVRTDSASFLSERQRIVSSSALQAGSASPRFVSAQSASRDPPVTLPPLHVASGVELLAGDANHPSDGELIRGDAATIASPQVPAVGHPDVSSRHRVGRGGPIDRPTRAMRPHPTAPDGG